jgi:hypothetical protein
MIEVDRRLYRRVLVGARDAAEAIVGEEIELGADIEPGVRRPIASSIAGSADGSAGASWAAAGTANGNGGANNEKSEHRASCPSNRPLCNVRPALALP